MKQFVSCIMLFHALAHFCPPDLFDNVLFVQTTNRKIGKSYGQAFHRKKTLKLITIQRNGHHLQDCCLLFQCQIISDSFVTPRTVAHQAPLSMGFPRQEYWKILLQGILPTPGLNLGFLHWQADSLSLSHLGSPSLGMGKYKSKSK